MSILRKYKSDPSHVLDFKTIEVDKRITYVEKSIQILDRRKQVLRNNAIPLVKVLW